MTLSRKNIITAAGSVLALAVLAYLFFGGGDAEPAVVLQGAAGSSAEVQFSSLVAELNGLSFTTGILSDERFLSLVDIRTAIVPEAVGRVDPFAPFDRTPADETPAGE